MPGWLVLFNEAMAAVLVLIIVAAFIWGQRYLDSSYLTRSVIAGLVVVWAIAWALVEHLA